MCDKPKCRPNRKRRESKDMTWGFFLLYVLALTLFLYGIRLYSTWAT